MYESIVSSEGQTILPREVLDALGLVSGDRIRYIIFNEQVRFMKVGSVKRLEGMLERPDQKPATLEEMYEAIVRGAIESRDAKE